MSPDEIAVEIGERVRGYREERGLSRDQLAPLVGLSLSALVKLESPGVVYWPSLSTLLRLSAVLEVELGELVPEREDRAA